ncbi:MAG: TlpA disulfide reductase family protein [Bacteroidota bacterium]
MKNPILLFSFLLIVLFSCESSVQSQGFSINGVLKNAVNETIYLDYLTMTDAKTLDTTQTDANGKFAFSGIVKEYGLVRVRTVDNNAWLFLINNKDKVTINGDRKNPTVYTIKGGKDNQTFQFINDFMVQSQIDIDAKNKRYVAASQSNADPILVNKIKDSIMSQIADFETRFKKLSDTTNNHIIMLYASSFLNLEADMAYGKKILARMESVAPKSIYTAQFKDRLTQLESQLNAQKAQQEKEKNTAVGGIAPDINLKTPDGVELKLSSLRGKVVLLDFWASWCAPCRRENPNVVALYKKHKDNGFTVYSVSLDKAADPWKLAIQNDGLIWPNHVSDLAGWSSSAAALYGVTSIPRTFLIDKDGKIVATNLRGEELDRKVEELLLSE